MLSNYLFITYPIQVSQNGTWGQKDVADIWNNGDVLETATADGVPPGGDGGNVPLYAVIKPVDETTHSVSAANWKINNQTYSSISFLNQNDIIPEGGYYADEITCHQVRVEWVNNSFNGTENITLPDGVEKIVMIDTSDRGSFQFDAYNAPSLNTGCIANGYSSGSFQGIQYNSVHVLVYLDPNFEIGTSNVDTIIDFDGDGQVMCGQQGSGVPGFFKITVELAGKKLTQPSTLNEDGMTVTDGEPHASISVYPWGWGNDGQSYTWQDTYNMTGQTPLGSGMNQGLHCPGQKEAYMGFTAPSSGLTNNSTVNCGTQAGMYKPYWFYITPDPGYVLSRHMFQPLTHDGSLEQVEHPNYGTFVKLDHTEYGSTRYPAQQQTLAFNAMQSGIQGLVGGLAANPSGYGNSNCPGQSWTNMAEWSQPPATFAGYGFPPFGIGTEGITGEPGIPTTGDYAAYSVVEDWTNNWSSQYYGATLYKKLYCWLGTGVAGGAFESTYTYEKIKYEDVSKASVVGSLDTFWGDAMTDDGVGGSEWVGQVGGNSEAGYMQIIDGIAQDSDNPMEMGVYGPGYYFGSTSAWNTFDNVSGANVFNSEGLTHTMPDGSNGITYCPSDFIGNTLIVAINWVNCIQPGQHGFPNEIKFRLIGAAVPITDEECVPCDVEIECE